MEDNKGGDLFIVDNSNSGWTAQRYLHEWAKRNTSQVAF